MSLLICLPLALWLKSFHPREEKCYRAPQFSNGKSNAICESRFRHADRSSLQEGCADGNRPSDIPHLQGHVQGGVLHQVSGGGANTMSHTETDMNVPLTKKTLEWHFWERAELLHHVRTVYAGLSRFPQPSQVASIAPSPPPTPSPMLTAPVAKQATICDSILACPQAALDNSWLSISGIVDVVRGRTFVRHDWILNVPVTNSAVFFAGNDFKNPGRASKAISRQTLSHWYQTNSPTSARLH